MSRRLRVIQTLLDDWLDTTAPRQVRVLSVCAGDGRDLIEVLARRHDSDRVRAALLEYDIRNVESAELAITQSRLAGIDVRHCDAADPRVYAGVVPADLVLLAGIFGNVEDDDVRRLVAALPQLCTEGARVIWTRHHRPPDLTPQIRTWFADAGYVEEFFTAPEDAVYSVGAHRFSSTPQPWSLTDPLFTFIR
jgi:hypothetical protein